MSYPSYDNIQDPIKYTNNALKEIKAVYQKEYKNMQYVLPDKALKILNVF
jgi:hypothetical protein